MKTITPLLIVILPLSWARAQDASQETNWTFVDARGMALIEDRLIARSPDGELQLVFKPGKIIAKLHINGFSVGGVAGTKMDVMLDIGPAGTFGAAKHFSKWSAEGQLESDKAGEWFLKMMALPPTGKVRFRALPTAGQSAVAEFDVDDLQSWKAGIEKRLVEINSSSATPVKRDPIRVR